MTIRDLSRPVGSEWCPPIGAMGGPPAHELYRDLVAHGGLRLMKDGDGNPWVDLQDGERRHSFRVPGMPLRGALDRFRMRRNLRPVPESDLEDFARVVQARVSDPDVRIPIISPTSEDGSEPEEGFEAGPSAGSDESGGDSRLEQELDAVLAEVRSVRNGSEPAIPPVYPLEGGPVLGNLPPAAARATRRLDLTVSGAVRAPNVNGSNLPKYVRVLSSLVEEGGWLGTLEELGRLTGEEPEVVYGSLLKYHAELTGNNLVVAPVEVEDGWRWLVVDRTRLRSASSRVGSSPNPSFP